MKRCPTCGNYKSEDQFYKNRARYDGLSSECKHCGNIRRDAWIKRFPEKVLEYDKTKRNNPEYKLAKQSWSKIRYEKHKEEILKNRRERYIRTGK